MNPEFLFLLIGLAVVGVAYLAKRWTGVVVFPFAMNVQTDPPAPVPPAPAAVSELRVPDDVLERFASKIVSGLQPLLPPVPPAPTTTPQITAREVSANWMKRTVKYLNSFHFEMKGQMDRAIQMRGEIIKSYNDLPDFAKLAEEKEAESIVKASLTGYRAERLLSTLSDSAGNALLPKPFLAQVFVVVEQYGVARAKFFDVPMTTKTLDLKNLTTKPTAYWVTEGARILASDIAFGTGQLVTVGLAGLALWTSELTEDEAIAHLPILTRLMGEQIALKEDQAGFLGDGTPTYGSQTGIFGATNLELTLAAGKVNFGDASLDDFRTNRDLLSTARRVGAEWFLHPDIISILEGKKSTTNEYIFRQPTDANTPGILWGFRYNAVDAMPSLADSGASKKFAILGNPQWMLFGKRRGLEAELSREAVIQDVGGTIIANLFQEDKAAVRLKERIAFKQPIDNVFAVMKTAAA